jgi:glycosyltransferase involved in cell wall biosynthesis
MKIALVHDYLKEYGGAEGVLHTFHQIWPDAPIYTLVYLPKFLGPHQYKFNPQNLRPLIPSWIPLLAKLMSPLRLIAPILFSRLDLTKFDLVIVSATGAYNPNLIKAPKSAHICYCHTPPRYLYGLPTARVWKKHWWVRIPAEIANHFLRMVDFQSAQKVDSFIANSQNTAERIRKFYRKKAIVIYPPVDLGREIKNIKPGSYYLTGGRLAMAKRMDLPIKACTKLKLPLKVFGRMFAGYGQDLKKIAGPTIEFLGEVSDKKMHELFASCHAFICAAIDEDFGITPVLAMAAGRPVIAYRGGGYLETVIEGKTGEFFPPSPKASEGHSDELMLESLMAVLKKFNPQKYKTSDCLAQAQKFSKERFQGEILQFTKEKVKYR